MRRILSALLLAILCLAALPSTAKADVAPPQNPPGSNPGPGSGTTRVRMAAETVVIEVLEQDPARAHITANFTMNNPGDTTEDLAVRFPIAARGGIEYLTEIRNIAIRVDGRTTTYRRVDGPEPRYGYEGETAPWAEFDVSFPPGEDVAIEFSYDLDGSDYEEMSSTSFYYILSTGAGWNGTIGSAEIILRLPYDANPLNVIQPADYGTPPGGTFTGREVHWLYNDLEPTAENDFEFFIIKPATWKRVLDAQATVVANPDDGEAWGGLGKAYRQALFPFAKNLPRDDPGGVTLYRWSRDAYEQAVTLDPQDGLLHAGYAELLLDYNEWPYFYGGYNPDIHRGLQELQTACRLIPDDPALQKMIEKYEYWVDGPPFTRKADGTLDFPLLTRTPTPEPTGTPDPRNPIPTQDPTPTPEREPVQSTLEALAMVTPEVTEPAQTATPAPKASAPICGGTALLLPLVGLGIWQRKGKSKS
jgi:hypothetical protein